MITLSKLFKQFFESEKIGSVFLIFCTMLSLLLANTIVGYPKIFEFKLLHHPISFWINDGLMTIFFLLIGLELEREFYIGELSKIRQASLPVIAAIGGMVMPAFIYYFINKNTVYQAGAGIPTATDIAFAIGVSSLLGNKIPSELKIFLTALAVIDDLGAILLIGIFYTHQFAITPLLISLSIFGVLLLLNRFKINWLPIYLIGGVLMWYFMHQSGIHATITGILLAFAIPFANGKPNTISYQLQKKLHQPVAFIILPLFALANTCILLKFDDLKILFTNTNSIGIITGLSAGKVIGISLFCFFAVKIGISKKPLNVSWKQIIGVGFLGGIGFTMSIFITLLAFENVHIINQAKLAIIVGSVLSAIIGYTWLKVSH